MKYLIILFLFPFALNAQEIQTGPWVLAKVAKLDGTTIINLKNFVKYRFSQDGNVKLGASALFYSINTNYTIADSILTIGRVTYKIDKLSKDSLIFHENKENIDIQKFRKYYYINSHYRRPSQKPTFNVEIQDSVYTATRYLFPDYNDDFNSLLNEFGDGGSKGDLRINFIINKKGKLVDFKVLENNNITKSDVNSIIKAFQATKNNWAPATLNNQNINVSVEILLRIGDFRNVGVSFIYPFIERE